MAAAGPRRLSWWNSIRARVLIMLSLALLPIGIIAVLQTGKVARAADESAEIALLALSDRAAQEDRLAIERAFGAADMLGSVLPLLLDRPEMCTDFLRQFVEREEIFSFIGVLPMNGQMECSSTGQTFDFSGFPNFAESMKAPKPRIEVNRSGPLSETSVIIVSYPYFVDGVFSGYVSVSIPHANLFARVDSLDLSVEGLLDLVTFNPLGVVLTAQGDINAVAALLPDDLRLQDLATASRATAFRATATNGERHIYTHVPIVGSPINVLGIWREGVGASQAMITNQVPATLFPVLMWFASLVVAIMALYSLVIRHIAALRHDMDVFAATRRLPAASTTSDMPNEIAALHQRFTEMTDDILREEARLESLVREKNVLLKEIHHRVKNNLQMIASIMNMQIRAAQHEETVLNLQRIQERVSNLASIHRDLYTSPEGGRVNVGELIARTVDSSIEMSQHRRRSIQIEKKIEDVLLFPDQAVPLSLLAAEATTNAIKYMRTGTEGGTKRLEVELVARDGRCLFRISNDVTEAGRPDGTGVGGKLIRAFAVKLGADLQSGEKDGVFSLEVSFPVAAFEAEAIDY